jgi:hypothetical protein
MICGRYEQPASACFDEVDVAVRAMTDRVVAFNAHVYPAPKGSVIFNTENLPFQVPDWETRFAGHELWDISAKNCALTGAKHVPIGYHPSMERFKPEPYQDIDVVFCGCMNERRAKVLRELRDHGLNVVHVDSGSLYGAQRDAILARSKLALNMLFYEDGIFPVLRTAHLAANRVATISEECVDVRGCSVPYAQLVDAARLLVCRSRERKQIAQEAYESFKAFKMRLPS